MADSVVVIGMIGGPFGISGWMHVRSFTEPAANLLTYSPWQLWRRGGWAEVAVQARPHRGGFVARVDGIADRDAAAALRGADIGISAAALPPPAPDEYYWRDLAGQRVVNTEGTPLGRVARLFPTPAHDVLVVEDDDAERLLPFVREVVLAVRDGSIVVDWQPHWP